MKIPFYKLIIACCIVSVFSIQQSEAQVIDIVTIIKQAITKVVKAVDLEVQRLQTQTIWLQNAQKVLENTMSELKLDDIADWVEKQRKLYADYFQELWQVKMLISDYDKVKDIINKQAALVAEYKHAYGLVQQDKHFTPDEIAYMYRVYSGILDESLKQIDKVLLVINAFVTQMSDESRLEIINQAASGIDKNLSDLRQFNQQNIILSLQRAKDENDVSVIKQLYGLQ